MPSDNLKIVTMKDGDSTTDLLWHRSSNNAYFVTLVDNAVPGSYQYVGGGGDADMSVIYLEDEALW